MSITDVRGVEIDEYLNGVRAALADLPVAQRDSLLEDLSEHLAEVAASEAAPLAVRLGPPAVFAAELRAAAGVPAAATLPPTAGAMSSTATLDHIRALATSADERVGHLLGYDSVRVFVVAVQPGWWLVRGLIVSLGLLYASGDIYYIGSLETAGFVFTSLVLLLGPMISVRIGREVQRAGQTARILSLVASAALAIIGLYVWWLL